MSSPSNLGTPQPFNFQQVAEMFIRSGELPEINLSQEQVNELANRVLLSGLATPEHFKNLQGVTSINTETSQIPIPARVLETIFTQYKDSLVELKIGSLEPEAELHIPHSLTHLRGLYLPPSVSPLQAKAILLSAFQHAEEGGVEEYRAKTAHIQEKLEQELGERRAELQRTLPERKTSSIKQKEEREKRYLDSLRSSQMPEAITEAVDSRRAPGEVSQAHTPKTAKRQRTREEPIDDSAASKETSEIRIPDRIAAPPPERTQELMHVKVTTLEQLELLLIAVPANARIHLDLSVCQGIDNDKLQEISATIGSLIIGLTVTDLPQLDLQGCHFPNLKLLKAGNTGITDAVLRQIAEISPGLNHLDLTGCRNVTLEGCSFPNLMVMNALYSGITDGAIRQLTQTSPGLKQLVLVGCRNGTFEGCSFPNLEVLNVGDTGITNEGLHQLAHTSLGLKYLALVGCRNVTLEGRSFPKLEVLDASFTGITDAALRQIAETSPGLKHLVLTACRNMTLEGCSLSHLVVLSAQKSGITDGAIHQLAQTSPGLKHLDIRGCENVTLSPETIKQLNPAWQNLSILR